jgi:hypothetical protein
LFDHATSTIPIAHIIVVHDCVATQTFDFGNNFCCWREVVTFAGENNATFECQIDGGAWVSCTSPFTTPSLPNGAHSISVRQTDTAGQLGTSAGTISWTIDDTAPDDITITGTPSSPTNLQSATLTMHGLASGTTFDCNIDGAGWQVPCPANPKALTGLAAGDHTFAGRQVRNDTHVAGGVATVVWTVDLTPPATPVIGTQPGTLTKQTAATFGFSGEPGATFVCSVDGGGYSACPNPFTIPGPLADGVHTFAVKAVDVAGNLSASAATYSWTVDTTAPAAPVVTQAPPALTNQNTSTIAFTLGTDGAGAECQLDGGAWVACASPLTESVGDGSHTVNIRVLDAAGNVSPSTAVTWTVDATPPASAPTIGGGPAGGTSVQTTSATFTLTGANAGGATGETYLCKLDGGAWKACSSPVTTPTLADGSHTLLAEIVDAAGNVSPVATRTWTVDTTAPASAPTIVAAPANPSNDSTPTFAFTGAAAGETYVCKLDSGAWVDCTSPFTANPALTDGAHAFYVALKDAAGNIGPADSAVWMVDTTAPATQPTMTTVPSNPSAVTTPSFAFTGAAYNETYLCILDGGTPFPCTSPYTGPALLDGSHTFSVALVDEAGNVGTPVVTTWTIAATPPVSQAVFVSGPSGPTSNATPIFVLSGATGGQTYLCQLDGGAWQACASPLTTPTLADGSHTLAIRTANAAGVGGPIATRSFTVDTSAPAAPTMTAVPSNPSNSAAATVTFTAEPGATVQCSLDGATWTTCTSPLSLTGLADGSHTLLTRAVDAAGNVGATSTTTWTVDTTPPANAPIVNGQPISPTNQTTANMTFASSESGSTFECLIDGVGWSTCTSPIALTGLADGSHVVKVRELDPAGNASPTTTVNWVVDTYPPTSAPTISGLPRAGGTPTSPTSQTSAVATLTTEAGTTLQCKVDTGGWASCHSPFGMSGLTEGDHTLQVRSLDAAGNAGPVASQVWTVDTTPPANAPVLGQIPPLTADFTPTITFTGDVNTTFLCQVDGGAWIACTSPFTADPLLDGTHTISVRQVDVAGNVGPAAAITFVVDTNAPPEVVVTGVPASPTNQTGATLTLTGEPGATIECQVDGGAWQSPCSANPLVLAGLTEGAHVVTVRQVDAANNTSFETSVRWDVDTTPPVAPGASPRPNTPTNNQNATIGITAAAGTTLQCRLGSGAWLPCNPPVSYTGLPEGSYVLEARSLDAAGNASTVTQVAWTVDLTPPTGTAAITSGPTAITASSVATFAFTLGVDGATAQCSFDGGAFAACASPITYPNVDPGTHAFRVRLLDAAGNVGSNVTTYPWEVFVPTTPPPGSPGISVNAGAAWATSSSVVVDVIWPAGTRYIELSNDPAFGSVTRRSISTQVAWTLAGSSGTQTVYARFLDVSAAPISTTSDGIGVDAVAPTVEPIGITWSAAGVLRITPTLADLGSGVVGWQATTDTGNPGATIPASTTSVTRNATAGAVVYVRAIDLAGNVGSWESIAAPPVAATPAVAANGIVVAGAAAVTRITTVSSAGASNVEIGCVSTDGSGCDVKVDLRFGKRLVASGTRRLAGGSTESLLLGLPKDLLRRLAVEGTLGLDLSLYSSTNVGSKTSTAPVTFQAPIATGIAVVDPNLVPAGATTADLKVRCTGDIPFHCAGPITLIEAPRGKSLRADAAVGTATVAGAAGDTLTTKVTLNAAGKKLLARYGKLRVVAKMTVPATGAVKLSKPFLFQTVRADDWLRRVLAEMARSAPARWFLNNTLDAFHRGEVSAKQAAAMIEKHTLDERQNTVKRIELYLQAPPSQKVAEKYLMLSYTKSVLADKKTIAWLKAGGHAASDPWRYHAQASAVKAKLVALLLKAAKPLRIPVPPATNLYP